MRTERYVQSYKALSLLPAGPCRRDYEGHTSGKKGVIQVKDLTFKGKKRGMKNLNKL